MAVSAAHNVSVSGALCIRQSPPNRHRNLCVVQSCNIARHPTSSITGYLNRAPQRRPQHQHQRQLIGIRYRRRTSCRDTFCPVSTQAAVAVSYSLFTFNSLQTTAQTTRNFNRQRITTRRQHSQECRNP